MSASTPFNFSVRTGLLFTIEGAVLSLIAVTFILGFALLKWLRRTVITWGRERPSDPSDSSLFLNLMLADMIQALGIMPNIKWMSDAMITEGTLCTAQAALKQVGIVGVSLTSLVIALHTFAVLVLRWMPPRHASKLAVLLIWVCTGLIIGIPNAVHRNEYYYGPNGYWCWIRPNWTAELIVTEYLWVWLAAVAMLLIYTVMYCVMRGWFDIGRSADLPMTSGNAPTVEDIEEARQTKAIAKMMLYFPAVYIVTVLPNSISRWLYFSGTPPPAKFALFANTVFALSGLANFILFLTTRPTMVVGEKVVVVSEPPDSPRSPSISKRTYSESSSLGQLPDRKLKNQNQYALQDISRDTTIASRLLSDNDIEQSPMSLTPSLPSTGYLTANREHHGRSRKIVPEAEDEDEGRLPG
ncbi:hypothetical protein CPB83DRAFT_908130 [Crepidotus variabilis]|uniref:Glucose receptor Git3 N-terminal domain-containing protein n=1 Tax=Crepidotus variabilis TaxID=179855 RepID=A0A9P6JNS4_9AGAR|nr:hypothetical protein CPB83DRAFT_908130 [Crepidotus variabilis]